MTRFSFSSALLVLALVLCGAPAHGGESTKVQARKHFKQAVALFDQRRFGDALAEFERSYAMYSAYGTLYNIGQVRVALGHPVEAVRAFEKYLVQGGASIPAAQRAQVEAELKAQKKRIGKVVLEAKPDGAEVRVDGRVVGKSPLTRPIQVAAGPHLIEVMLDGYRSQRRKVEVVGQGRVQLQLELRSLSPAAPAPALAPPPAAPADSPAPVASPRPLDPRPQSDAASTPSPAETAREPSSSGTPQRVLGYTIAGLGLIGASVGLALAVDGQAKHNDALEQWAAGDREQAQVTEEESSLQKTQGYVLIGVGGAVMLTGAIVLLTAPSSHSARARWSVSPWVASSGAGTAVRGVW
jgi:hypothetical protein